MKSLKIYINIQWIQVLSLLSVVTPTPGGQIGDQGEGAECP
jgi:hypothetical protein